ncbi:MAG: winged helix-turn-helix domain-containing protein [Minisyncoccales bacterium]
MTKKNIILSLNMDDPKAKKIAEILGSKNCKKIIDFLSETSEASQKDISEKTNIPLNTLDYNLKKLLEAGLVEKTRNFFWSVKGKKIPLYKLSNKSILISPVKKEIKSKIKSVLPVAVVSGLLAILLRQYLLFRQKTSSLMKSVSDTGKLEYEREVAESFDTSKPHLEEINPELFTQPSEIWIWFLAGMLIAILIFTIINWRKI